MANTSVSLNTNTNTDETSLRSDQIQIIWLEQMQMYQNKQIQMYHKIKIQIHLTRIKYRLFGLSEHPDKRRSGNSEDLAGENHGLRKNKLVFWS